MNPTRIRVVVPVMVFVVVGLVAGMAVAQQESAPVASDDTDFRELFSALQEKANEFTSLRQ